MIWMGVAYVCSSVTLHGKQMLVLSRGNISPLKDRKERKVKDGKIVGGEQRRANGSKLPLSESFDEH